MLPNNNNIIRTSKRDPYLHYDDKPLYYMQAFERGGLDIRNTIMGLDVSDWHLYLERDTNLFKLERDGKLVRPLGAPSYGRIPESIDFAFDDEMRFYWGYSYMDTEGEVAVRRLEFNWYHPEQNQTVKLILDNVHTIKIILDNAPRETVDDNDICLIYVRNTDRVVCIRYQRELFAIEHRLFLLRTGESLMRVGRTVNDQVQFEIGKLQKPYTWVRLLDHNSDYVNTHKGHPIWVLENEMNEAYNNRPTLSDITYKREIDGSEYFLIASEGDERQLSLNVLQSYMSSVMELDNYFTKAQSYDKFYIKERVYTKSEAHELFEHKGICYSKAQSDSRYAMKNTSYSKGESDSRYSLKSESYTREDIDREMARKDQTYTREAIDNEFVRKGEIVIPDPLDLTPYLTIANAANTYAKLTEVYTPTHIDLNFAKIRDIEENYYTKSEIDEKFAEKRVENLPYRDNLLTNGALEYGDLTGWSDEFIYDTSLSPLDAYGNALYKGTSKRIELGQVIPIIVNQTYKFTYEYRYVNKITPGVDLKIALKCYDRDMNVITSNQIGFDMISRTKLRAPLAVGDKTMRVEDTDGWLALPSPVAGRGCIMFFNYVDKGGYTYDESGVPYTRHMAVGEYIPYVLDANDDPDAHIDGSNGTIHLREAFNYPNPYREDGIWPEGTIVARHMPIPGPDEFIIGGGEGVNLQVDSPTCTSIKKTKTFYSEYNTTGSYSPDQLPPGTAFVVPVLYPNHNFMRDKSEYGVDADHAPDATADDIVAINQLYIKIDIT